MPPESSASTPSSADAKYSFLISVAAAALLALFALVLFASVRQESGLGDKTMHLFGGYEYLKHLERRGRVGSDRVHCRFSGGVCREPVSLRLGRCNSSLHALPDPLAFANELFGGPSHIAQLAADYNADRAQGLEWTGSTSTAILPLSAGSLTRARQSYPPPTTAFRASLCLAASAG